MAKRLTVQLRRRLNMGIVAASDEERMRLLFAQERTAVNAGLFLDGLLGGKPRKTGWMRAEAAGDQSDRVGT